LPVIQGRYRLLQHLGKGSMATVYRALDERLQREVVVKLLLPELLANPDSSIRFLRETRALAHLSHPHIVAIYGANKEANWHYVVLEYINGQTIQQLYTEKPGKQEVEHLTAIMRHVLQALSYIHQQRIIHGNVKPNRALC
jgi:serine/threonine protein kinase